MINHFLLFAGLFFSIQVAAQTSNGLGQKIVQIDLPINTVVNQNALITTVNNHLLEPNQMGKLGILTNQAKLYLNFTNKNNKVVFEVSNSSKLLTSFFVLISALFALLGKIPFVGEFIFSIPYFLYFFGLLATTACSFLLT